MLLLFSENVLIGRWGKIFEMKEVSDQLLTSTKSIIRYSLFVTPNIASHNIFDTPHSSRAPATPYSIDTNRSFLTNLPRK